MLRLGGFNVLEAASGSEALDVVANGHSLAAVVSDIRMPLMDGVDFSHRVRATHPEMPIPGKIQPSAENLYSEHTCQ